MVCVSVASIPAVEVVFRLAGDRPSRDLEGLYVPFGRGGYRLGANVNTTAEFLSGRMRVVTDALGLRAGTAPGTRLLPGDTVDMLLLGDSQGFGNLLSYEESLAGRIAADGANAGVRVVNASVGGHYLENQVEIASWLRRNQGVHFRQVLVLWTPLMIETAGQYNTATVTPDGRLSAGATGIGWRIRYWLKTSTVSYIRLRAAYSRLNSMIAELSTNGRAPPAEDPVAIQLYDPQRTANGRLERLQSSVQRMVSWADSNSTTLFFVYIPLALELDFTAMQGFAKLRGVAVADSVPLTQLRLAADAGRVPVASCRSSLKRVRQDRKPLTMGNDPHYSSFASAACAIDIWRAVERVTERAP